MYSVITRVLITLKWLVKVAAQDYFENHGKGNVALRTRIRSVGYAEWIWASRHSEGSSCLCKVARERATILWEFTVVHGNRTEADRRKIFIGSFTSFSFISILIEGVVFISLNTESPRASPSDEQHVGVSTPIGLPGALRSRSASGGQTNLIQGTAPRIVSFDFAVPFDDLLNAPQVDGVDGFSRVPSMASNLTTTGVPFQEAALLQSPISVGEGTAFSRRSQGRGGGSQLFNAQMRPMTAERDPTSTSSTLPKNRKEALPLPSPGRKEAPPMQHRKASSSEPQTNHVTQRLASPMWTQGSDSTSSHTVLGPAIGSSRCYAGSSSTTRRDSCPSPKGKMRDTDAKLAKVQQMANSPNQLNPHNSLSVTAPAAVAPHREHGQEPATDPHPDVAEGGTTGVAQGGKEFSSQLANHPNAGGSEDASPPKALRLGLGSEAITSALDNALGSSAPRIPLLAGTHISATLGDSGAQGTQSLLPSAEVRMQHPPKVHSSLLPFPLPGKEGVLRQSMPQVPQIAGAPETAQFLEHSNVSDSVLALSAVGPGCGGSASTPLQGHRGHLPDLNSSRHAAVRDGNQDSPQNVRPVADPSVHLSGAGSFSVLPCLSAHLVQSSDGLPAFQDGTRYLFVKQPSDCAGPAGSSGGGITFRLPRVTADGSVLEGPMPVTLHRRQSHSVRNTSISSLPPASVAQYVGGSQNTEAGSTLGLSKPALPHIGVGSCQSLVNTLNSSQMPHALSFRVEEPAPHTKSSSIFGVVPAQVNNQRSYSLGDNNGLSRVENHIHYMSSAERRLSFSVQSNSPRKVPQLKKGLHHSLNTEQLSMSHAPPTSLTVQDQSQQSPSSPSTTSTHKEEYSPRDIPTYDFLPIKRRQTGTSSPHETEGATAATLQPSSDLAHMPDRHHLMNPSQPQQYALHGGSNSVQQQQLYDPSQQGQYLPVDSSQPQQYAHHGGSNSVQQQQLYDPSQQGQYLPVDSSQPQQYALHGGSNSAAAATVRSFSAGQYLPVDSSQPQQYAHHGGSNSPQQYAHHGGSNSVQQQQLYDPSQQGQYLPVDSSQPQQYAHHGGSNSPQQYAHHGALTPQQYALHGGSNSVQQQQLYDPSQQGQYLPVDSSHQQQHGVEYGMAVPQEQSRRSDGVTKGAWKARDLSPDRSALPHTYITISYQVVEEGGASPGRHRTRRGTEKLRRDTMHYNQAPTECSSSSKGPFRSQRSSDRGRRQGAADRRMTRADLVEMWATLFLQQFEAFGNTYAEYVRDSLLQFHQRSLICMALGKCGYPLPETHRLPTLGGHATQDPSPGVPSRAAVDSSLIAPDVQPVHGSRAARQSSEFAVSATPTSRVHEQQEGTGIPKPPRRQHCCSTCRHCRSLKRSSSQPIASESSSSGSPPASARAFAGAFMQRCSSQLPAIFHAFPWEGVQDPAYASPMMVFHTAYATTGGIQVERILLLGGYAASGSHRVALVSLETCVVRIMFTFTAAVFKQFIPYVLVLLFTYSRFVLRAFYFPFSLLVLIPSCAPHFPFFSRCCRDENSDCRLLKLQRIALLISSYGYALQGQRQRLSNACLHFLVGLNRHLIKKKNNFLNGLILTRIGMDAYTPQASAAYHPISYEYVASPRTLQSFGRATTDSNERLFGESGGARSRTSHMPQRSDTPSVSPPLPCEASPVATVCDPSQVHVMGRHPSIFSAVQEVPDFGQLQNQPSQPYIPPGSTTQQTAYRYSDTLHDGSPSLRLMKKESLSVVPWYAVMQGAHSMAITSASHEKAQSSIVSDEDQLISLDTSKNALKGGSAGPRPPLPLPVLGVGDRAFPPFSRDPAAATTNYIASETKNPVALSGTVNNVIFSAESIPAPGQPNPPQCALPAPPTPGSDTPPKSPGTPPQDTHLKPLEEQCTGVPTPTNASFPLQTSLSALPRTVEVVLGPNSESVLAGAPSVSQSLAGFLVPGPQDVDGGGPQLPPKIAIARWSRSQAMAHSHLPTLPSASTILSPHGPTPFFWPHGFSNSMPSSARRSSNVLLQVSGHSLNSGVPRDLSGLERPLRDYSMSHKSTSYDRQFVRQSEHESCFSSSDPAAKRRRCMDLVGKGPTERRPVFFGALTPFGDADAAFSVNAFALSLLSQYEYFGNAYCNFHSEVQQAFNDYTLNGIPVSPSIAVPPPLPHMQNTADRRTHPMHSASVSTSRALGVSEKFLASSSGDRHGKGRNPRDRQHRGRHRRSPSSSSSGAAPADTTTSSPLPCSARELSCQSMDPGHSSPSRNVVYPELQHLRNSLRKMRGNMLQAGVHTAALQRDAMQIMQLLEEVRKEFIGEVDELLPPRGSSPGTFLPHGAAQQDPYEWGKVGNVKTPPDGAPALATRPSPKDVEGTAAAKVVGLQNEVLEVQRKLRDLGAALKVQRDAEGKRSQEQEELLQHLDNEVVEVLERVNSAAMAVQAETQRAMDPPFLPSYPFTTHAVAPGGVGVFPCPAVPLLPPLGCSVPFFPAPCPPHESPSRVQRTGLPPIGSLPLQCEPDGADGERRGLRHESLPHVRLQSSLVRETEDNNRMRALQLNIANCSDGYRCLEMMLLMMDVLHFVVVVVMHPVQRYLRLSLTFRQCGASFSLLVVLISFLVGPLFNSMRACFFFFQIYTLFFIIAHLFDDDCFSAFISVSSFLLLSALHSYLSLPCSELLSVHPSTASGTPSATYGSEELFCQAVRTILNRIAEATTCSYPHLFCGRKTWRWMDRWSRKCTSVLRGVTDSAPSLRISSQPECKGGHFLSLTTSNRPSEPSLISTPSSLETMEDSALLLPMEEVQYTSDVTGYAKSRSTPEPLRSRNAVDAGTPEKIDIRPSLSHIPPDTQQLRRSLTPGSPASPLMDVRDSPQKRASGARLLQAPAGNHSRGSRKPSSLGSPALSNGSPRFPPSLTPPPARTSAAWTPSSSMPGRLLSQGRSAFPRLDRQSQNEKSVSFLLFTDLHNTMSSVLPREVILPPEQTNTHQRARTITMPVDPVPVQTAPTVTTISPRAVSLEAVEDSSARPQPEEVGTSPSRERTPKAASEAQDAVVVEEPVQTAPTVTTISPRAVSLEAVEDSSARPQPEEVGTSPSRERTPKAASEAQDAVVVEEPVQTAPTVTTISPRAVSLEAVEDSSARPQPEEVGTSPSRERTPKAASEAQDAVVVEEPVQTAPTVTTISPRAVSLEAVEDSSARPQPEEVGTSPSRERTPKAASEAQDAVVVEEPVQIAPTVTTISPRAVSLEAVEDSSARPQPEEVGTSPSRTPELAVESQRSSLLLEAVEDPENCVVGPAAVITIQPRAVSLIAVDSSAKVLPPETGTPESSERRCVSPVVEKKMPLDVMERSRSRDTPPVGVLSPAAAPLHAEENSHSTHPPVEATPHYSPQRRTTRSPSPVPSDPSISSGLRPSKLSTSLRHHASSTRRCPVVMLEGGNEESDTMAPQTLHVTPNGQPSQVSSVALSGPASAVKEGLPIFFSPHSRNPSVPPYGVGSYCILSAPMCCMQGSGDAVQGRRGSASSSVSSVDTVVQGQAPRASRSQSFSPLTTNELRQVSAEYTCPHNSGHEGPSPVVSLEAHEKEKSELSMLTPPPSLLHTQRETRSTEAYPLTTLDHQHMPLLLDQPPSATLDDTLTTQEVPQLDMTQIQEQSQYMVSSPRPPPEVLNTNRDTPVSPENTADVPQAAVSRAARSFSISNSTTHPALLLDNLHQEHVDPPPDVLLTQRYRKGSLVNTAPPSRAVRQDSAACATDASATLLQRLAVATELQAKEEPDLPHSNSSPPEESSRRPRSVDLQRRQSRSITPTSRSESPEIVIKEKRSFSGFNSEGALILSLVNSRDSKLHSLHFLDDEVIEDPLTEETAAAEPISLSQQRSAALNAIDVTPTPRSLSYTGNEKDSEAPQEADVGQRLSVADSLSNASPSVMHVNPDVAEGMDEPYEAPQEAGVDQLQSVADPHYGSPSITDLESISAEGITEPCEAPQEADVGQRLSVADSLSNASPSVMHVNPDVAEGMDEPYEAPQEAGVDQLQSVADPHYGSPSMIDLESICAEGITEPCEAPQEADVGQRLSVADSLSNASPSVMHVNPDVAEGMDEPYEAPQEAGVDQLQSVADPHYGSPSITDLESISAEGMAESEALNVSQIRPQNVLVINGRKKSLAAGSHSTTQTSFVVHDMVEDSREVVRTAQRTSVSQTGNGVSSTAHLPTQPADPMEQESTTLTNSVAEPQPVLVACELLRSLGSPSRTFSPELLLLDSMNTCEPTILQRPRSVVQAITTPSPAHPDEPTPVVLDQRTDSSEIVKIDQLQSVADPHYGSPSITDLESISAEGITEPCEAPQEADVGQRLSVADSLSNASPSVMHVNPDVGEGMDESYEAPQEAGVDQLQSVADPHYGSPSITDLESISAEGITEPCEAPQEADVGQRLSVADSLSNASPSVMHVNPDVGEGMDESYEAPQEAGVDQLQSVADPHYGSPSITDLESISAEGMAESEALNVSQIRPQDVLVINGRKKSLTAGSHSATQTSFVVHDMVEDSREVVRTAQRTSVSQTGNGVSSTAHLPAQPADPMEQESTTLTNSVAEPQPVLVVCGRRCSMPSSLDFLTPEKLVFFDTLVSPPQKDVSAPEEHRAREEIKRKKSLQRRVVKKRSEDANNDALNVSATGSSRLLKPEPFGKQPAVYHTPPEDSRVVQGLMRSMGALLSSQLTSISLSGPDSEQLRPQVAKDHKDYEQRSAGIRETLSPGGSRDTSPAPEGPAPPGAAARPSDREVLAPLKGTPLRPGSRLAKYGGDYNEVLAFIRWREAEAAKRSDSSTTKDQVPPHRKLVGQWLWWTQQAMVMRGSSATVSSRGPPPQSAASGCPTRETLPTISQGWSDAPAELLSRTPVSTRPPSSPPPADPAACLQMVLPSISPFPNVLAPDSKLHCVDPEQSAIQEEEERRPEKHTSVMTSSRSMSASTDNLTVRSDDEEDPCTYGNRNQHIRLRMNSVSDGSVGDVVELNEHSPRVLDPRSGPQGQLPFRMESDAFAPDMHLLLDLRAESTDALHHTTGFSPYGPPRLGGRDAQHCLVELIVMMFIIFLTCLCPLVSPSILFLSLTKMCQWRCFYLSRLALTNPYMNPVVWLSFVRLSTTHNELVLFSVWCITTASGSFFKMLHSSCRTSAELKIRNKMHQSCQRRPIFKSLPFFTFFPSPLEAKGAALIRAALICYLNVSASSRTKIYFVFLAFFKAFYSTLERPLNLRKSFFFYSVIWATSLILSLDLLPRWPSRHPIHPAIRLIEYRSHLFRPLAPYSSSRNPRY
eukprot:gene9682-6779_t